MLLVRTRKELQYRLKKKLFDICGMQAMLDESEHRHLEHMMGFPGQYAEHREFEINLLKKFGLMPSHRLLDLGCGPLTLGIPAMQYLEAGGYTGVDVRSTVLDDAYRLIGRKGLAARNPRLVNSKTFGRHELGDQRFDFIVTFSMLYHLSDDLLHQCIRACAHHLQPKGTYFANVNISQEESEWLEFPFVKRDIAFYERAAKSADMSVEVLGPWNQFGHISGIEKNNVLLRFSLAQAASSPAIEAGQSDSAQVSQRRVGAPPKRTPCH